MKHILTAIIAIILLSVAFLVFANSGFISGNDNQIDSGSISDSEDEDQTRFYGDTLYQFDGKTIVDVSSEMTEEDITSLLPTLFVTYVDTIPVDTCMVFGNVGYVMDGPKLKFFAGVDTVQYDIRHLPDSVNPISDIFPDDLVEYKFTRSFELTDSSWDCDFSFLAYLPKEHPAWLNQFIATIMRNDIQALFLDNKGADRILKEYYGIKAVPKKVDGINAAKMTPKEIARHFALEHERLYREEFNVEEYDGHGPKFDYKLEVTPAWRSSDGRYVTYRFYSYYYTMGAHGLMEEYYLTFNESNGNLLGYNDIIGLKVFPEAIKLLEQQLTVYKSEYLNFEGTFPADVGEEELEANASEIIKEVYKGSYYPRPALTKRGVVFSYQPYEKGAFAEGILHFVIPYSKLKPKIAR